MTRKKSDSEGSKERKSDNTVKVAIISTIGVIATALITALVAPVILKNLDKTPTPLATPFVTMVLVVSATLNFIATEEPTPFVVDTNTPVSTDTPLATNAPTLEVFENDLEFLVVSEMAGKPCGGDSRNEFIELYNSSENPIDVSGLWITDGDEADEISTWNSRYTSIDFGSSASVNTTIIPSHGFAVILAPGYPLVQNNPVMPYIFPEGTIILTLAEGQLIGDEKDGIQVGNRDVIVLYKGNKSIVEKVISTYGSPTYSGIPLGFRDDGRDGIPILGTQVACWSAERIIPINDDIETNWRQVEQSSPGESSFGAGDY